MGSAMRSNRGSSKPFDRQYAITSAANSSFFPHSPLNCIYRRDASGFFAIAGGDWTLRAPSDPRNRELRISWRSPFTCDQSRRNPTIHSLRVGLELAWPVAETTMVRQAAPSTDASDACGRTITISSERTPAAYCAWYYHEWPVAAESQPSIASCLRPRWRSPRTRSNWNSPCPLVRTSTVLPSTNPELRWRSQVFR